MTLLLVFLLNYAARLMLKIKRISFSSVHDCIQNKFLQYNKCSGIKMNIVVNCLKLGNFLAKSH